VAFGHGPSSPHEDSKAIIVALKEVCRARATGLGQKALDAFDEVPWGRDTPSLPNPGDGPGQR
jgi:hypothetical protein